ncbi:MULTISPECIES: HNH endonuclease family protein [Mycobacteriaceae]|uniref:HNH endonuclease family protein n=1 Tax=Mycolicibacterium nivoides TaxID=2487344 RepID=A0ABW9LAQ6_9MYCO|nr:HNH endonuclease family protein [Mycolicibacterium senegalense]
MVDRDSKKSKKGGVLGDSGELARTVLVIAAVIAVIAVIVRIGPNGVRAYADTAINWATERINPAQSSPNGIGGTGAPSDDPSTLTVAKSGPMRGYARDRFGAAWTDDVDVEYGHNGCNTRDDILARDMTGALTRDGCKVLSGTLADPYTGTVITFTRGRDTSALVQIDHLVALANAWVSGAEAWPPARRKQIANDPLNLMASDGSANQSKGAASADQWLPPNPSFQCTYVKRQVQVKNKYRLTVTAAEKSVMMRFRGYC